MLGHGSHLFSQHQQQRPRTHQHLLLQQPISHRLNPNPRSNYNRNHSPSNLNPRSNRSNLSNSNNSRISSSNNNNSCSLNLSRSLSFNLNLNHNLRPRPRLPLKGSPSLSNGHSSQLCSSARENWSGIRTETHGVSAS